jgi:hypothetical protein
MSYEKYPIYNSWLTSKGDQVDVKCYQDKENNIGYLFSINFQDNIRNVNSISGFNDSEFTFYNSYAMKNIARIVDIPIEDRKYYNSKIIDGKLYTQECEKPKHNKKSEKLKEKDEKNETNTFIKNVRRVDKDYEKYSLVI